MSASLEGLDGAGAGFAVFDGNSVRLANAVTPRRHHEIGVTWVFNAQTLQALGRGKKE